MVGFHREVRNISAWVATVHGAFPVLTYNVVPLTEKFLASIAGWPVVFEARKIRAAGKVKAARYEPPLLKGAVRAGSRLFASGLRIASPTEVENICSCRASQVEGDGMICPHSVAVALEIIHGHAGEHPEPQP
jgi:hypothetical protein